MNTLVKFVLIFSFTISKQSNILVTKGKYNSYSKIDKN